MAENNVPKFGIERGASKKVRAKREEKGSRKYVFLGFHDRIARINVDVYHRVEPVTVVPTLSTAGYAPSVVGAAQLRASFLRETVIEWTGKDASIQFRNFRSEIMPFIHSLPMIIYFKKRIVNIILKHIRVPNTLALQGLLAMLPALARDLQSDLFPYFGQIVTTVIEKADTRKPEELELIFSCLAYLFKYNTRILVDNLTDVYFSYYISMLASKKDFIRRFAAETFAYLLRKVPQSKLESTLLDMLTDPALVDFKAHARSLQGTPGDLEGEVDEDQSPVNEAEQQAQENVAQALERYHRFQEEQARLSSRYGKELLLKRKEEQRKKEELAHHVKCIPVGELHWNRTSEENLMDGLGFLLFYTLKNVQGGMHSCGKWIVPTLLRAVCRSAASPLVEHQKEAAGVHMTNTERARQQLFRVTATIHAVRRFTNYTTIEEALDFWQMVQAHIAFVATKFMSLESGDSLVGAFDRRVPQLEIKHGSSSSSSGSEDSSADESDGEAASVSEMSSRSASDSDSEAKEEDEMKATSSSSDDDSMSNSTKSSILALISQELVYLISILQTMVVHFRGGQISDPISTTDLILALVDDSMLLSKYHLPEYVFHAVALYGYMWCVTNQRQKLSQFDPAETGEVIRMLTSKVPSLLNLHQYPFVMLRLVTVLRHCMTPMEFQFRVVPKLATYVYGQLQTAAKMVVFGTEKQSSNKDLTTAEAGFLRSSSLALLLAVLPPLPNSEHGADPKNQPWFELYSPALSFDALIAASAWVCSGFVPEKYVSTEMLPAFVAHFALYRANASSNDSQHRESLEYDEYESEEVQHYLSSLVSGIPSHVVSALLNGLSQSLILDSTILTTHFARTVEALSADMMRDALIRIWSVMQIVLGLYEALDREINIVVTAPGSSQTKAGKENKSNSLDGTWQAINTDLLSVFASVHRVVMATVHRLVLDAPSFLDGGSEGAVPNYYTRLIETASHTLAFIESVWLTLGRASVSTTTAAALVKLFGAKPGSISELPAKSLLDHGSNLGVTMLVACPEIRFVPNIFMPKQALKKARAVLSSAAADGSMQGSKAVKSGAVVTFGDCLLTMLESCCNLLSLTSLVSPSTHTKRSPMAVVSSEIAISLQVAALKRLNALLLELQQRVPKEWRGTHSELLESVKYWTKLPVHDDESFADVQRSSLISTKYESDESEEEDAELEAMRKEELEREEARKSKRAWNAYKKKVAQKQRQADAEAKLKAKQEARAKRREAGIESDEDDVYLSEDEYEFDMRDRPEIDKSLFISKREKFQQQLQERRLAESRENTLEVVIPSGLTKSDRRALENAALAKARQKLSEKRRIQAIPTTFRKAGDSAEAILSNLKHPISAPLTALAHALLSPNSVCACLPSECHVEFAQFLVPFLRSPIIAVRRLAVDALCAFPPLADLPFTAQPGSTFEEIETQVRESPATKKGKLEAWNNIMPLLHSVAHLDATVETEKRLIRRIETLQAYVDARRLPPLALIMLVPFAIGSFSIRLGSLTAPTQRLLASLIIGYPNFTWPMLMSSIYDAEIHTHIVAEVAHHAIRYGSTLPPLPTLDYKAVDRALDTKIPLRIPRMLRKSDNAEAESPLQRIVAPRNRNQAFTIVDSIQSQMLAGTLLRQFAHSSYIEFRTAPAFMTMRALFETLALPEVAEKLIELLPRLNALFLTFLQTEWSLLNPNLDLSTVRSVGVQRALTLSGTAGTSALEYASSDAPQSSTGQKLVTQAGKSAASILGIENATPASESKQGNSAWDKLVQATDETAAGDESDYVGGTAYEALMSTSFVSRELGPTIVYNSSGFSNDALHFLALGYAMNQLRQQWGENEWFPAVVRSVLPWKDASPTKSQLATSELDLQVVHLVSGAKGELQQKLGMYLNLFTNAPKLMLTNRITPTVLVPLAARLLGSQSPQMRTQALKLLSQLNLPYLTPYIPRFMGLSADATFRSELASLSVALEHSVRSEFGLEASGVIDEAFDLKLRSKGKHRGKLQDSSSLQRIESHHRPHLVPFLLSLLMPRIRHVAKGTNANRTAGIRNAALSFVAKLPPAELVVLIALVLKPFSAIILTAARQTGILEKLRNLERVKYWRASLRDKLGEEEAEMKTSMELSLVEGKATPLHGSDFADEYLKSLEAEEAAFALFCHVIELGGRNFFMDAILGISADSLYLNRPTTRPEIIERSIKAAATLQTVSTHGPVVQEHPSLKGNGMPVLVDLGPSVHLCTDRELATLPQSKVNAQQSLIAWSCQLGVDVNMPFVQGGSPPGSHKHSVFSGLQFPFTEASYLNAMKRCQQLSESLSSNSIARELAQHLGAYIPMIPEVDLAKQAGVISVLNSLVGSLKRSIIPFLPPILTVVLYMIRRANARLALIAYRAKVRAAYHQRVSQQARDLRQEVDQARAALDAIRSTAGESLEAEVPTTITAEMRATAAEKASKLAQQRFERVLRTENTEDGQSSESEEEDLEEEEERTESENKEDDTETTEDPNEENDDAEADTMFDDPLDIDTTSPDAFGTWFDLKNILNPNFAASDKYVAARLRQVRQECMVFLSTTFNLFPFLFGVDADYSLLDYTTPKPMDVQHKLKGKAKPSAKPTPSHRLAIASNDELWEWSLQPEGSVLAPVYLTALSAQDLDKAEMLISSFEVFQSNSKASAEKATNKVEQKLAKYVLIDRKTRSPYIYLTEPDLADYSHSKPTSLTPTDVDTTSSNPFQGEVSFSASANFGRGLGFGQDDFDETSLELLRSRTRLYPYVVSGKLTSRAMFSYLSLALQTCEMQIRSIAANAPGATNGIVSMITALARHRSLVPILALPCFDYILPSFFALLSSETTNEKVAYAVLETAELLLDLQTKLLLEAHSRYRARNKEAEVAALREALGKPGQDDSGSDSDDYDARYSARTRRRREAARQKRLEERESSIFLSPHLNTLRNQGALLEAVEFADIDVTDLSPALPDIVEVILERHTPVLLHHLNLRLEAIATGKLFGGRRGKLPERELAIAARLAPYATDSSTAQTLSAILITFLPSGRPKPPVVIRTDASFSSGHRNSGRQDDGMNDGYTPAQLRRDRRIRNILVTIEHLVPNITHDFKFLVRLQAVMAHQLLLNFDQDIRHRIIRVIECISKILPLCNDPEATPSALRRVILPESLIAILYKLAAVDSFQVNGIDEEARYKAYELIADQITASSKELAAALAKRKSSPKELNATELASRLNSQFTVSVALSEQQVMPLACIALNDLYSAEFAIRERAAATLQAMIEGNIGRFDEIVRKFRAKQAQATGKEDDTISRWEHLDSFDGQPIPTEHLSREQMFPSGFLRGFISNSLRTGINSPHVPVRKPAILLIGSMARAYPQYYTAFAALTNANPDIDFYYSITHVQLERRRQILLRIIAEVERARDRICTQSVPFSEIYNTELEKRRKVTSRMLAEPMQDLADIESEAKLAMSFADADASEPELALSDLEPENPEGADGEQQVSVPQPTNVGDKIFQSTREAAKRANALSAMAAEEGEAGQKDYLLHDGLRAQDQAQMLEWENPHDVSYKRILQTEEETSQTTVARRSPLYEMPATEENIRSYTAIETPFSGAVVPLLLPILMQIVTEASDAAFGGAIGGLREDKQGNIKRRAAYKDKRSPAAIAAEAKLVEIAFKAIGAVCSLLPWEQYHRQLVYFLTELRAQRFTKEKALIRGLCSVLDAFPFDIGSTQSGTSDGSTPQSSTAMPRNGRSKGAMAALLQSSPSLMESKTSHTSSTESMGDLIRRTLAKGIVPELFAFCTELREPSREELDQKVRENMEKHERGRRDNSRAANVRRTQAMIAGRVMGIVRISVVKAIVKLLQRLPSREFQDIFPRLVRVLCMHLARRSQLYRDIARKTLVEVFETVGVPFMFHIITELKFALARGYQLHVLGFVVNELIAALARDNRVRPGDIDYCLPLILPILLNDLIGPVGREKQNPGVRNQHRETKASRAPHSFFIIARLIQFNPTITVIVNLLSRVLLPDEFGRAVPLSTTQSISSVLKLINAGLELNPSVSTRDLLLYVHTIMHQATGAPDDEERRRQRIERRRRERAEKEAARKVKEERYARLGLTLEEGEEHTSQQRERATKTEQSRQLVPAKSVPAKAPSTPGRLAQMSRKWPMGIQALKASGNFSSSDTESSSSSSSSSESDSTRSSDVADQRGVVVAGPLPRTSVDGEVSVDTESTDFSSDFLSSGDERASSDDDSEAEYEAYGLDNLYRTLEADEAERRRQKREQQKVKYTGKIFRNDEEVYRRAVEDAMKKEALTAPASASGPARPGKRVSREELFAIHPSLGGTKPKRKGPVALEFDEARGRGKLDSRGLAKDESNLKEILENEERTKKRVSHMTNLQTHDSVSGYMISLATGNYNGGSTFLLFALDMLGTALRLEKVENLNVEEAAKLRSVVSVEAGGDPMAAAPTSRANQVSTLLLSMVDPLVSLILRAILLVNVGHKAAKRRISAATSSGSAKVIEPTSSGGGSGRGVAKAKEINETLQKFYARTSSVVAQSLRICAMLLRLPLPRWSRYSAPLAQFVLRKLLDTPQMMSNSASASITAGVRSCCFAVLTSGFRYCTNFTLSQDQMSALVRMLQSDLKFQTRHAVVFQLLRCLLTRKVVAPEIYDIMNAISEIMVQHHSRTIRLSAAACILQFLLDYPLMPKRIRQHVEFLVNNLQYPVPPGRSSVIELLTHVVMKFPAQVLTQLADIVFFPAVVALYNEEVPHCRMQIADMLRHFFTRVAPEKRASILTATFVWLDSDQPAQQIMSAQVLSQACCAMKEAFIPYLPRYLKRLKAQMQTSIDALARAVAERQAHLEAARQTLGYPNADSMDATTIIARKIAGAAKPLAVLDPENMEQETSHKVTNEAIDGFDPEKVLAELMKKEQQREARRQLKSTTKTPKDYPDKEQYDADDVLQELGQKRKPDTTESVPEIDDLEKIHGLADSEDEDDEKSISDAEREEGSDADGDEEGSDSARESEEIDSEEELEESGSFEAALSEASENARRKQLTLSDVAAGNDVEGDESEADDIDEDAALVRRTVAEEKRRLAQSKTRSAKTSESSSKSSKSVSLLPGGESQSDQAAQADVSAPIGDDSEQAVTLDAPWQYGYAALCNLERVLTAVPHESLPLMRKLGVWDRVLQLAVHSHAWVREAASRVMAKVFAATDLSRITDSEYLAGSIFAGISGVWKAAKVCVHQLNSKYISEKFADNIMKNLMFMILVLYQLGDHPAFGQAYQPTQEEKKMVGTERSVVRQLSLALSVELLETGAQVDASGKPFIPASESAQLAAQVYEEHAAIVDPDERKAAYSIGCNRGLAVIVQEVARLARQTNIHIVRDTAHRIFSMMVGQLPPEHLKGRVLECMLHPILFAAERDARVSSRLAAALRRDPKIAASYSAIMGDPFGKLRSKELATELLEQIKQRFDADTYLNAYTAVSRKMDSVRDRRVKRRRILLAKNPGVVRRVRQMQKVKHRASLKEKLAVLAAVRR